MLCFFLIVQIGSCRTTVSMLSPERHDPNFLPEEPLGIFAFPTSPISSPILSMFSFITPKWPNSLYSFLIFPIPDLSGAVYPPHPTAVFIIPAIACIPSRDSFALFGEAKENRNAPPPPHTPVTQMDQTTVQSIATHKTFKNILLHETEMTDQ